MLQSPPIGCVGVPVPTTTGLIKKFQELFGQRVKAYRRNKGATQFSLAEDLHISRAKLANIEAGTQRTSVFLLARLSQVLDVPVSDLVPSITDAEILLGEDQTVVFRADTPPEMLAKELEELDLSVETGSALEEIVDATEPNEQEKLQNIMRRHNDDFN